MHTQSVKIPGLKGVITIQGNQSTSLNCDRKSLEIVHQLPLRDLNEAEIRLEANQG